MKIKIANFLIAFFICIMFSTNAYALVDELLDVYQVKSIEVDVTDESASKAREKAINQGVSIALDKVFSRLIMQADKQRLPILDEKQAFDLVKELVIVKEKNSAVRYIATVDIKFKPENINNILLSNSIPFIQSKGKKVLLIPIYNHYVGAEPLLWEEENPLILAWKENQPDNIIVPIVIPYGNALEIYDISKEDLKDGTLSNVDEIKEKYGVEDVFLVNATMFSEIEPRIDVVMQKLGVGYYEVMPGFSVPISEEQPNVFGNVLQNIVFQIQDLWKQNQVVQFNASSQIIALIPTGSLKKWVKIKKILKDMPLINEFKLQAMKKDRAQVNLSFSGGINRFAVELAKKDLVIETMGSYWLIKNKNDETSF